MPTILNYTEPKIVTSKQITKRSYIEFYLNGERVRIGNGDTLSQNISPNRAKTVSERTSLLAKLHYELKKALEDNNYPVKTQPVKKVSSADKIKDELSTVYLLFSAVRKKLQSDLSRKYKRNLKTVYRQFRNYLTTEELAGSMKSISISRIESFLKQFDISGTYYMNKRRDLGVLFSSAGRQLEQPVNSVQATERRRTKAKLHVPYEKGQLRPVLNYLKEHYPKLHVCCLLTYASWLRPHEEIRLLVPNNFKQNNTEIHLAGDENKGGKVRVVYVPDYVRTELEPLLNGLQRGANIFSGKSKPLNESYFNTQWGRAYKKLATLGLIRPNQTIYSFRHTAAVETYRRSKDVYLLQKLLGHSSIVVTLKYLRSLGEFNSEELRNAAPTLD